MKKSKKTPSRIKYDKSHPTVSARLPLETKERLLKNLAILGMTLPDAFRVLAGELEVKAIPVEEARRAGYEEARDLYRITYKCAVCGKPMELTSPKAKQAASEYMQEHRWGHAECYERKRRSSQ